MTKREREIAEARKKWEDTVTQQEVMEKFKISSQELQKLRREGVIKNFRYTMPSKPGSKKCPGKKPVYSLTELAEIFCP